MTEGVTDQGPRPPARVALGDRPARRRGGRRLGPGLVTEPGASAVLDDSAPAVVRRAVLPWRRRIRDVSRFDFMPLGGVKELVGDPFGWIPLILLFPLWLPAAFVGVLSVLELALELALLPVALLYRRGRRAWPVQVLDSRGQVVTRVDARSWYAAGLRRQELLNEITRQEQRRSSR